MVLVVAFASCTRVNPERPASEIMFQVARHSAVTKAEPADYKDAYGQVPFGTYCWYKALNEEDNAVYFVNKKVAYEEPNNRWITVGTTYYWPASGKLDFISYSPYSADGLEAPAPVITENSINYATPWNVETHQGVDVMYADKATGLGGNINTFGHGYEGVPTLFRHALAKLSFKLRTGLTSMTVAGETTRWEIDITSFYLQDIFTTGTLSLNLAVDGSWAKPETNAWAPTESISRRDINISGVTTLTEESQSAGGAFFVLPQTLESQVLHVVATIRTYRDANDGTGEQLVLTETGVTGTAALKTDEIDTWGINQHITYILTINPIKDIETSIILFDPAVVGWDEVVAETTMVL